MNKKAVGFLLIAIGPIIIGSGLYIYLVAHTIYPNSESSRVQDLNWLLKTFGKAGTAVLFALIGLVAMYAGVKKIKK